MSESADETPRLAPTDALVRMKRPDGRTYYLRVDGEHLQRVMDLANGEFGDRTIDLGGPEMPEAERGR